MANTRAIYYLVAFSLLVISLLMVGFCKAGLEFAIRQALVIQPTSPIYEKWVKAPFPVRERFYFFNITNPSQVQTSGAKPILQEVGPYTYLKYLEKENVEFHDNGATVSYNENVTYYFSRDESVGDETDIVTTLNPLILVLADTLGKTHSAFHTIGSLFSWKFDMTEAFMHRSIDELLHSGYEDPLAGFLSSFTSSPSFHDGKFGYMVGENGTQRPTLKVNTGKAGMDAYQFIQEYDEETSLPFWKSNYCNMLNGTIGQLFVPGVDKDSPLNAFLPDFCRSVSIEFEEEILMNGLKTYKFGLPKNYFKMAPNKTCFCVDEYTCRDGIYNLSPCRHNAPAIASGPHFYYGTKSDLNSVIGLSPNKKKHEIFLQVEPMTGVVVAGFKRAQMNLPLKKFSTVPALHNVPEVMLPIFWLEETATLPDEAIELLRLATQTTFEVAYCLSSILTFLAAVLIFKALTHKPTLSKDKLGEYFQSSTKDPIESSAIQLLD